VSEFTVKVVAFTPPKVTFGVCVRPVPVIITGIATGPPGGKKLVSAGVTLKTPLLVSSPDGIHTTTEPVLASRGTAAVRRPSPETLNVAAP
jgi:hypothetical protein